jgi:hypothetical protein
MPVLDQDDGFANRVTGGRVEKRVGVKDPNHRPMLMRPDYHLFLPGLAL